MQQVDPRLAEIDNALYRISVKALIIHNGKLLFVKEKGDEWWSVPGGGIDYGETIQQALLRELKEELGLEPTDIKTEDIVAYVSIGAIINGLPKANLFYHVDIPIDKIKPTNDVLARKWCAPEDLADLFLSPSTGSIRQELATIIRQKN